MQSARNEGYEKEKNYLETLLAHILGFVGAICFTFGM